MRKNTIRDLITKGIIYIILALIALVCVYPFIYTVAMSFSTTAEATKTGFHLYPKEVSLSSYVMALSDKNIYTGYVNTIYRTVLGTISQVILTAMFAYALSKPYMPNRKLFNILMLFTMLFDGGLIPSYLLIKNLGLIDNRLVYILPIIGAYNVIIVKSFFNSLPESLPESAKLDGANEFVILFRIILPLSKPVLATITLWMAVGHWNEWMDGMLYINSNSKQILQIFLQRIIKFNQSDLVKFSQVGYGKC